MVYCGVESKDIEAFLKAVHTGQPADDNPLLQLESVLFDNVDNAPPRQFQLSEKLNQLITTSYQECAALDGIELTLPKNRVEAGNQINADYSHSNPYLEAWSALYYRYVFPVQFSVEDLAASANVVPQQLRRRINSAMTILANRICAIVYRAQHIGNLPIFDGSRLIGIQEKIGALKGYLNPIEGPYIVSLEGMGGVGKTTLARAFVDNEIGSSDWEYIYWVSGRRTEDPITDSTPELAVLAENEILHLLLDEIGIQDKDPSDTDEIMTQLKKHFTSHRCLVVLDNLETVTNYRKLIPQLFEMTYPTKFLLTSRFSLNEFDFIRTIPVTEMTLQQANQLFHAEVKRRGRTEVLLEQQFQSIFNLVGGNPLAIKLVAAQCMRMPLARVLTSLQEATIGIDRLFRYLYMHIWTALSEPSRMLLMSFLAISPEGEELDFIQRITGLDFESLVNQLEELDKFSMLEMSGTFESPRYYLHHLTATFLQTDILHRW